MRIHIWLFFVSVRHVRPNEDPSWSIYLSLALCFPKRYDLDHIYVFVQTYREGEYVKELEVRFCWIDHYRIGACRLRAQQVSRKKQGPV